MWGGSGELILPPAPFSNIMMHISVQKVAEQLYHVKRVEAMTHMRNHMRIEAKVCIK